LVIQRYLFREILLTFLGVTVILLLIFLSGTFVRILSETVEGRYPASILFSLFALRGTANLMFVLPLSFFLGTMLALGRLYKDSEMTAMYACGVQPRTVRNVALLLSLFVAVVVGALSLWGGPRADEQSHRILDRAEARARIQGITAGRFNRGDSGDQLIYVERMSADHKKLFNLFGYATDKQGLHLISAATAHQMTDAKGDRYLVLVDGYRYEGTPGKAGFKVIKFAQHGILLRRPDVVRSHRRRNAISTLALWRRHEPGDMAEVNWRIAMPVSTVILALLAVPLSRANPRQGRYGRLFSGILAYIIYNNLLTVGRSWIGDGKVPLEVGLWWVHGLMLAVALMMFTRQQRGELPWAKWWRR